MARKLSWILLLILLILQGQLWLGRGSLPNVMHLRETLSSQVQTNQQGQINNQRQEAELRDLKEGKEMIEERARRDIGMVRQSEIFVQYSRNKP
jgi:cell division protein FtsB